MKADLWNLYRQMFRSRLFEEAAARLWHQGRISGEMHMGIGEEAIAAGVVDHLRDGDAMALDHRGTPPMLLRGVDPIPLLREFLGRPEGLCGGMGGHMHLFSQAHLAASSGVVGASGPAGAGFGLAAQLLRPGAVAVAFFGEGAMNQGMLLESLNLAVVWQLPVLYVCKDNEWAVTTHSDAVTGGSLTQRAQGFGMPAVRVDGADVKAVWHAAHEALGRAREGEGPTFLHARCAHPNGHFLGDPVLRINQRPLRELPPILGPLLKALISRRGAPFAERVRGLRSIIAILWGVPRDGVAGGTDPIARTRQELEADEERLAALENDVKKEVQAAVAAALA